LCFSIKPQEGGANNMERINIITHKGVRILALDGKNLKEDELCESIEKHSETAIANKINLMLLDVTNTRSTTKVKDVSFKSRKKMDDALGQCYSAIIGLSSLQRLVANTVNRDQYFATDMEDGKNWLVKKSAKVG
jgi:hypothetical protein